MNVQTKRESDTRITVSTAEAVRISGIGRTTIFAAIGSGALPSIKIGARRLIKIADLEAWLDKHAA